MSHVPPYPSGLTAKHRKEILALKDLSAGALRHYYEHRCSERTTLRVEEALVALRLERFRREPSDPDPRSTEVS